MRKQLLCIAVIVFSLTAYAQSFNYQAVIRDATNNPIINQSIGVQLSILEGSPTGTNVYTETHTVTSNDYGVIALSVGTGTTTDVFSTINWSQQNQWIDIAIDITGGITYVNMGTSKLQQVPHAMFAANSGDKAFSTTGNVTSNASGSITIDDFVFGSTQLDEDGVFNSGDENRMFFDKSKGAIRAGQGGSEWDEVNVGSFSTAFGNGNTASGVSSVALGVDNEAIGNSAIALGEENIVTGNYAIGMGIGNEVLSAANGSLASGHYNIVELDDATALGSGNIVKGRGSIAAGRDLTTESFAQASFGAYNTAGVGQDPINNIATDRLLVVGNGTNLNKSDALVMLKNGNTTLNGQLTIDGDNQGTGAAYTLPAQDGVVNQVIVTDGAGNTSWGNASGTGSFSTTANVTSNTSGVIATDDFVFGSSQIDADGVIDSGDESMMKNYGRLMEQT